jgi:hypothetical protein
MAASWPAPDPEIKEELQGMLDAEWGIRVISEYVFDCNFEPVDSFTEPRIAKLLSGDDLDPTGIRDFVDGRILYDPKGLLASIKRRLRTYPDRLAERMIEDRCRKIRINVFFARTALLRRDAFSVRQALVQLVEDATHLLFASERQWYPGPKRIFARLRQIDRCPADLPRLLEEITAVERERFPADLSATLEELDARLRTICREAEAHPPSPDRP